MRLPGAKTPEIPDARDQALIAPMAVLRQLFEGESRRPIRFRYGLMLFDFLTIIFVAVTSFVADRRRAREAREDAQRAY
jgi:hypothetical protein